MISIQKLRRFSGQMLKGVLVVLLLIWSLLPIVWIVLTSLKKRVDIFASPPKLLFSPSLDAYRDVLSMGHSSSILPNLKNSTVVALGTSLFVLVLASLAGFAFSRYVFPGRRPLLYTVLASRLLPPITAVIPVFLMMSSIKLTDTSWSLILIYTAFNVPLGIWMMKTFFDTVPLDLEEAAMIDGTSRLGALWRVTLPLAGPGFAATAIFVFVSAWNEFMFAFIFTTVRAVTMPVVISQTLGEMQIYWQQMATEATIVILPVLLFSFFLQQHMVRGLTAGALK